MIESRRVPAMGGHATATIVGGSSGVLEAVIGELDRLEGLWSRFRPDSDLTRLNLADGEAVPVDHATIGLLLVMMEAARETRGAFDPTLLPALVDAGYATSRVDPSRTTLLLPDALPGGSLSDIQLDGNEVRMPRGLTLDAGGIGKGYAADRLCAMTRVLGATGAMVEIAGDLAVWGEAPQPGGWVIGIEEPSDLSQHLTTVRLGAGGVATSGTRKRRWVRDGIERHHLLDPRTHESSRADIHSVSVIAGSGARAEALTKYAFVNPIVDTLEWLPTRNAAGLVVDAEGTIHTTSNWGEYR